MYLLNIVSKSFIVLILNLFSIIPVLFIPQTVAAVETKWVPPYNNENTIHLMELDPQPTHILTVRDHFPQYRIYFSERKIQKEVYEEFLKETKSTKK